MMHVLRSMPATLLILASTSSVLTAEGSSSAEVLGADPARTNLRSVITDSLRLLMLEHSVRIGSQDKTRRALGGPFWHDYRRSVRVPQHWNDGDGWLVNYVGHPGHGAAAGFIWVHRDPNAMPVESGFGRNYWVSRLRASAWSTAYSLQFEFGPFSEASIGNVGQDPTTAGWVDHVMTPIGGLGVMVAEDALDRYVLVRIERRVGHPVLRVMLRLTLNPARSIANMAAARSPWYRESRSLTSRRP